MRTQSNRSASVCWIAVWQSHHFHADGGRRPSNLRFASGFPQGRRRFPARTTNKLIGPSDQHWDDNQPPTVCSVGSVRSLHCCTVVLHIDNRCRRFTGPSFQVDVGTTASVGDVCALRLTSTLASDSSVSFVRDFSFEVDREITFVLQGPNGPTVLDPLTETMLEVRVYNTGTETETFSLQINSNSSSPISLVLDSSSSVSVEAGASGMWTLKATAAEGSLGLYDRLVVVTHDSLIGQNPVLNLMFNLARDLTLQGPLDGRIVVQSGESSSVSISIENVGTSDLLLDTFTIAGLPGGVDAVLPDVDEFLLEAGATHNVSLNVSASAATSARTDTLTLQLFSDGAVAVLDVELQVVDRTLAQLSPNKNQIISGPSADDQRHR